jgi:hypothetical protein
MGDRWLKFLMAAAAITLAAPVQVGTSTFKAAPGRAFQISVLSNRSPNLRNQPRSNRRSPNPWRGLHHQYVRI